MAAETLARLRERALARFSGRWSPSAVFVVLTPGRSGSELLVELLRSQPGVTCAGEVLSVRHPRPTDVLLAQAASAGRAGASAYGCKVLVGQLSTVQRIDDPAGWVQEVADRGWLVIGLTRRHLLRQALSWVWADRTGRYHERGGERTIRAPLTVPPEELIGMLVAHEAANRFVDEAVAAAPSGIGLRYEDDLVGFDAHRRTVRTVMEALGQAAREPSTTLAPPTTTSLREALENYDQVAEVLSRTRFAPLLDG